MPGHSLFARTIPPVVTPCRWRDLVGAAQSIGSSHDAVEFSLRTTLEQVYGRPVVTLTDSATSALCYVFTHAVPRGTIVAIPGFGCIDVAAAVQGAHLQAIPYDIDPTTLAPVTTSLRAVLERGARVVVASHLFGFAIPLDDTVALCKEFDALLLEDAAQSFGARWRGTPAGAIGRVSVLSFGRGKGIGGGGGGAVLGEMPASSVRANSLGDAPSALSEVARVVKGSVIHAINRPSLYAIPSSIPSLRLGEMVFHPAQTPTRIGKAAASLARTGLLCMRDGLSARRQRALRLATAASRGGRCTPIVPHVDSDSTWLRAPMLLRDGSEPPASLGVYRAYPRAVPDQHEVADVLVAPTPSLPGSHTLARTLVTLPTHDRLSERDMVALEAWLSSSRAA